MNLSSREDTQTSGNHEVSPDLSIFMDLLKPEGLDLDRLLGACGALLALQLLKGLSNPLITQDEVNTIGRLYIEFVRSSPELPWVEVERSDQLNRNLPLPEAFGDVIRRVYGANFNPSNKETASG